MNISKVLASVFTVATLFSAPSFAKTQIDALVLYSPAAADLYDGNPATRINHLVETANEIYTSSNLDIELRISGVQEYELDDTASAVSVIKNAKSSDEIKAIRDSLGADLVILYRPYMAGQPCGLAYRPTSFTGNWRGISHVGIDCAAYVTAHEVGHNMGLAHSHAQKSSALLPYAMGHGVNGEFATVMAYGSAYGAKKIYKFSSPELDCDGLPCGIEAGKENQADAVKALRQTAPIVAALRESTQQCDAEQKALLHEVETAYNNQKQILAEVEQTLANLEAELTERMEEFTEVNQAYRTQRDDVYYPVYREYTEMLEAFRDSLSAYYDGQLDIEALMSIYNEYQSSRQALMIAAEELRAIYTAEYQPVLEAYKLADTELKTFKADEYKIVQDTMSELEAEYEEAMTLYACAA